MIDIENPQTTETEETTVPFNVYLATQMARSGKSNSEIAQELGYPRSNVIAMLKTGSMKLPMSKVGAMARALDIDPVHLVRRTLMDSSPETWEALRDAVGRRLVTENEMRLIEFIRSQLRGFDARLVDYSDFAAAIQGPLSTIAAREEAHAAASLAASGTHSRQRHAATGSRGA